MYIFVFNRGSAVNPGVTAIFAGEYYPAVAEPKLKTGAAVVPEQNKISILELRLFDKYRGVLSRYYRRQRHIRILHTK